ncbi:MAG TPA: hypothetical protein VLM89_05480, partial [Phycisphaerae bacterium]|nr:hypothetical protein [Phycisphaerae bacterium]
FFGIIWLVQGRRHRLRQDVAFARRRSARRSAVSRIRRSGGDPGGSPAAVLSAIGGYVADRLNLPPGSLTRSEVVRLLAERHVSPNVVAEVDRLLSDCEQARYAGLGQRDFLELARFAQRCIYILERERF